MDLSLKCKIRNQRSSKKKKRENSFVTYGRKVYSNYDLKAIKRKD